MSNKDLSSSREEDSMGVLGMSWRADSGQGKHCCKGDRIKEDRCEDSEFHIDDKVLGGYCFCERKEVSTAKREVDEGCLSWGTIFV